MTIMRKVLSAICVGAAAVFMFLLGANVHPQAGGNEMVTTSGMWTADVLGGIAIDKKMAGVVSDVVGASLDSVELETPVASARFWESIDLATADDIRASILSQTTGRKKGNSVTSSISSNSLVASNNTITTTITTNTNSSSSITHVNSTGITSWNSISSRSKLARFARTDNAALTCSNPWSAGGQGLAVCIGQCENKRSLVFGKSPLEGACHLLCTLAVAPCEKMNGAETIDAMVDLVVPAQYSDMARGALKTLHRLCLSAYAGATTAAQVSVYHAAAALDAMMDWLRTVFYPWAHATAQDFADWLTTVCYPWAWAVAQDFADWLNTVCYPWASAVAASIADNVTAIAVPLWEAVHHWLSLALMGSLELARAAMHWLATSLYPWTCTTAADIADIVATNAVSLWEAACRSSSAGFSAALEFVLDLSGPFAMRATDFSTSTAASLKNFAMGNLGPVVDYFWACPVGKMVEDVLGPMLGEAATGIFDAVGGFWAGPEMEAARETLVLLVEKGVPTVVEVVLRLWAAALEGGKGLVKTHLLADKPVSALLLLVVVHMACRYCKMRTARACTRELEWDEIIGGEEELSTEVGSTQPQASNLKPRYPDRLDKRRRRRRGNPQEGSRCLPRQGQRNSRLAPPGDQDSRPQGAGLPAAGTMPAPRR